MIIIVKQVHQILLDPFRFEKDFKDYALSEKEVGIAVDKLGRGIVSKTKRLNVANHIAQRLKSRIISIRSEVEGEGASACKISEGDGEKGTPRECVETPKHKALTQIEQEDIKAAVLTQAIQIEEVMGVHLTVCEIGDAIGLLAGEI